jgi:hypothetical protein
MIKIIIAIIMIWILITIAIPFFVFPGYIFKSKTRKTKHLQKIASKLKRKDPEKTLKNTYHMVLKHCYGYKKMSFAGIKELFVYNPEKLITQRKFAWCHSQNIAIRNLLINTGQFRRKDLKLAWRITPKLTIHQYSIITIKNKKFKVDPFYRELEKLK